MMDRWWPLLLTAAVLLLPILIKGLGWVRGGLIGLLAVGTITWCWLRDPVPPAADPDPPSIQGEFFTTSAQCAECHRSQYDSWYRTYHRTMTRDATPETVLGDFADTIHEHHGVRSRMTREGDSFYIETADPDWSLTRESLGASAPAQRSARFKIDRVVGSHWLQEYMHRTSNGRYVRLPLLFHLGERRWVPGSCAFLAPDTEDFWSQSRAASWNDSCLYCHNTEPSKNPVRGVQGRVVGYQTTVGELGIACAACHGPGTEHILQARTGQPDAGEPDVVHPARLSVVRRDEICGRCHGALVPRAAAWDPVSHRDPFIPGQELMRFNTLFRSEAEQAILAGVRRDQAAPPHPEPTDGRFWGDGTPLTTSLEFNGMLLSACYQGGTGTLSCLTCHTMHGDEPNYLLKPGAATNDACYKCHAEYRERLAEHTRHPAGSSGSLCYNCHMPHQVYSLMTTHRSHRIEIPTLAGSVGTGKPHACNLCHLDKSLGWTRDELAKWPGGKRDAGVKLSPDEEQVSAAILGLARADARTRVILAGAFASPAAREAAGVDWPGHFLARLLEDERYPAVRYLAHRGLKAIHGPIARRLDPFATARDREAGLRALRAHFDRQPIQRTIPHLPLTPDGLPDPAVLERLRRNRNDPDLTINE